MVMYVDPHEVKLARVKGYAMSVDVVKTLAVDGKMDAVSVGCCSAALFAAGLACYANNPEALKTWLMAINAEIQATVAKLPFDEETKKNFAGCHLVILRKDPE